MKKLLENRIFMLLLTSTLISVFLFLSFFVFIIAKSDIIDINRNRMDFILLIKDSVFFIFWLCFIPLIILCVKKFKQNL